MPIRISRTFWNKSLTGTVSITAPSNPEWNFNLDSTVTWEEQPTTLPSSDRPVIGDFRDFKGCAQLDRLSAVALCFNVMPDVSSVGVNEKDMNFEGIEDLIADQISRSIGVDKAQIQVQNLRYVDAERDASHAKVSFSADVTDLAHQTTAPVTIQISFNEA